jgi:hypothetical protein
VQALVRPRLRRSAIVAIAALGFDVLVFAWSTSGHNGNA